MVNNPDVPLFIPLDGRPLFGFVYIWRDRLTRRFYIGSHKGKPDDGYICSSPKMLAEYRKRRSDFRRRILAFCFTDRIDLLAAEQRWLNLISKEDFGVKYYNRSASAKGMLLVSDEGRKEAARKTAATKKRLGIKPGPMSEETKQKISANRRGIKPNFRDPMGRGEKIRVANVGKVHALETKEKIAAVVTARFSDPDERLKQSQRLTGRTLSAEHCDNMSKALKGNPALGWSSGSYWATDAAKDIQVKVGKSMPEGFRKGRRFPCAIAGKVWINDGKKNALIQKDTQLPDGFCLGKLSFKLRSDSWVLISYALEGGT